MSSPCRMKRILQPTWWMRGPYSSRRPLFILCLRPAIKHKQEVAPVNRDPPSTPHPPQPEVCSDRNGPKRHIISTTYTFSTGQRPGGRRWRAVIQRINACPLTPLFNQTPRKYDIFGKKINCECGYHEVGGIIQQLSCIYGMFHLFQIWQ